MKNKLCLFSLVVAIVAILLCTSRLAPVRAQPPATATPKTNQQEAVSPFLRELWERSQKDHSLYLVEGEPAQTKSAINQGEQKVSMEDSLDDLAARFNYRAERLPSGIVVFHKTYYDEHDLPSVTLAECLTSLKDIERVTEAINPHIAPPSRGRDPLANGILQTFTTEQLDAMQRGQAETMARAAQKGVVDTAEQNGVPVSGLNPPQKNEVWRIACYLYAQIWLDDFDPALAKAKALATQTPAFTFQDLNGLPVFGYEVRGEFVALSHPYQRLVGKEQYTPTGFDPTQPLQNIKAAVPVVPQAITLQTLVQRLHAESQKSATAAPDKAFAVDDALVAKRLCVVGDTTHIDSHETLRAAAALFGLRVVDLPESTTVTRVRGVSSAAAKQNIAQAGRFIEELLPLPLKNASQQETLSSDPALQKMTFANGGVVQQNPPSPLEWAAVRRLRQTVEAKIRHAPDKRVLLSDLDDKEKEAFAVVVMLPCLRPLHHFAKMPVPSFITNFDQTVLLGGISTASDGTKWFNVNMGRRLPNGMLAQGGSGFSTPLRTP